MDNGELSEIQKRYKKGIEPLGADDENVSMDFIEHYYKSIINKWVKYFVLKQRIKSTKVTKKLKRKKK